MKIYPVVDLESDWIPKQLYENFRRYASSSFVDNPQNADMIWVMSYYADLGPILAPRRFRRLSRIFPFLNRNRARRRKELNEKLIICSVHHLAPEKEELFFPYMRRIDALGDAVHFFSKSNIQPSNKYFAKPIFHLPYWINRRKFQPLSADEKSQLRSECGLPEGKTVIGSFQRDTLIDLVSPKLEKGPDIFCDIVGRLDREKTFVLLSGPRRDYVEARLDKAGVSYLSLGKVDAERMPSLYNCLDVYLVTSRIEGGPQAILECMATRTPIFSTPVGISEVLYPSVVLSTADEFVDALQCAYPNILDLHEESVGFFDVEEVVKCYEKTFEYLLDAYKRSPGNLPAASPDIQWHNIDKDR